MAAINVFVLCAYASVRFLFDRTTGKFEDNAFSWYFLAKGIFCSVSLILSLRILEVLARIARHSTPPEDFEE
jgi:hypothetical protein